MRALGGEPYYQYFCGEEFFQHELVLDRSSLSNWRKRMGEEKVRALLQESLSIATKTGAVKRAQLSTVIVDTTVQPKNVMFPTDARLLNRAREILVRRAHKHGVKLRQSYARVPDVIGVHILAAAPLRPDAHTEVALPQHFFEFRNLTC